MKNRFLSSRFCLFVCFVFFPGKAEYMGGEGAKLDKKEIRVPDPFCFPGTLFILLFFLEAQRSLEFPR